MDQEENLRLASRDGDIEKVKRLVKEGADPNGCDQHGNTSFHWCCMSDNCPVEVLSFLVSSSSTLVSLSKIRNNDGSTPTHLAFSSGNLELIKYIYKTDTSSMTECDYNDKMPVHYTTRYEILSFVISVLESSNVEVYKRIKIAVWCCTMYVPGSFVALQRLIEMMTFQSFICKFENEEDKEFVKFIIRIKKLQFKNVCTSPILHEVVKHGDVAIVTHFVNKIGCSINARDEDGNTLLHVACYNNHFAIVELLTNHEECYIQFEATDLNGRSALHIAAYRGHLQIVKHLVETKQCDTNVKDMGLNTLLHLACLNGHLNVVAYLSVPEICSNIEERGKDGFTLVHLAALKGHTEILKYLVEQRKCNVNSAAETTGVTPLHLACSTGNLDVVEYLSNNELCDINAVDNNGQRALHFAAEHGNLEVVKHFVEKKGSFTNVKDLKFNTPLHLACQAGHLDVVEYLSNNALCDVHAKSKNGRTALHSASGAGYLEVVKHLVENKGCDTNVKNDDQLTPLYVACYGGHLDVVEYLSSNDALCDVHAKFKNGLTALHLATGRGHLEVVKHLVERKGCDINVKNDDQLTPLYVACQAGHLDVVEYLSSNNALCDVHAKFKNGLTALHLATGRGHLEVVKHLVERKGCDINAKTNLNNTPLHVACCAGHLDIVEYLSDNESCDINAKDRNGRHGLHFAAEQGHLEVVKHLVERKRCDMNQMDGNNDTPLHLACSNVQFSKHDTDTGHIDTVKYLISNELCDINAKDGKGRTVAHLAVETRNINVLKTLFERGGSWLTGDEDGNTPLHYACSRKGSTSFDNASNINLIKFLVSQPDCNIDEVNKDGEHVLHILCKYDSDPNIIKYLISENQCSVNVFDSHGNHPLHLACKQLNIEHVIALTCSPNCDVDVINHLNGQHPLHILCETKSNDIAAEIAEHLIKKKQCDLNVCNENEYTPLGLAFKARNLKMVKLLTDETRCNINEGIHPLHITYSDVLCFFIRPGSRNRWKAGIDLLINKPSCDVNAQDSDGNTLLHLACRTDDHNIVKQLISHPKCDINSLNKNKKNPLLLVTRSKGLWTMKIIGLLLKTNKCDVNIRDLDGNTPLHQAFTNDQYGLQLVKLLSASPVCDINAENNEGVRPIHLAAKHGNLGVVCHLVNFGCDLTAKDKHGNTPMDYTTSTDIKDFLNNVVYGTPYMPGNLKSELIQYAFIHINSFFILSQMRHCCITISNVIRH